MSLNKSLMLHSTKQSPFSNKSRQRLQREDALNMSPILNESSVCKTLNDTSLRQALDDSTILATAGQAGDNLSEAFFEIVQSAHKSDILETLNRLSQVCLDSLELVEPWNRYNVQNYWLAEEANTWKLLHYLYKDSVQEHPQNLDSLPVPTLSQKTLVKAFIESNDEARLLKLLVNWLEACAAYQEESTKTSAPVINDVHWNNTLHHLHIGTSFFNKERSKAMVTCMDPDAPRRQRRAIHSDDQQNDNDLCKRIFTEVRCGKFDEAISLCLNAGQAWRAAILQGWRFLHYLPRDNPNAPLEIEGNPSRDLWKLCCLAIANSSSENVYYRATLGILCGYLPSTLAACQGNWKDLLWAHLKVQIEARTSKFLHEHHVTAYANTTPPEVLEELELAYSTEELSLDQIFRAVNGLMDGKKESQYQKCQRHLMLGQITAIMEESLEWIDTAEEKFVRFLAHLILILRQMGKDPNHDIGDKILEKYARLLIERLADGSVEFPELIAFYTSTVPIPNQNEVFSDLLLRVTKSDYRSAAVKAGLTAGVDVASAARVAIKKTITEIHEGYGSNDLTIGTVVAGEKDNNLISDVISSLEWLALLEDQVEDALWLSNTMIRIFIFIGNTEAASKVIVKINQMFPSFVHNISTKSSELREYLCLKAYLEALEEFATWYRHLISGQPMEIEPLPSDATFSDKVLHEQKTAQYEQQKTRWSDTVTTLSRHTKNLLYNILLFPGGWLLDENDSTASHNFSIEEKKERFKQLETLRRLCIPEVTILILKILQSGTDIESHKEVMKLSDLIAGENRCLYEVFTKEKLVEVLDRMKESSLLLLEKGRDMFGYEISED